MKTWLKGGLWGLGIAISYPILIILIYSLIIMKFLLGIPFFDLSLEGANLIWQGYLVFAVPSAIIFFPIGTLIGWLIGRKK